MTGAVPCTLVPLAEQSISSVATGALNATAPLFTVLAWFALTRVGRTQDDPFDVSRALPGVAIAFVGIGIFAAVQPLGDVAARGLLYALLAAVAHGVGAAYVRRWLAGTDTSGLVMAAIQPASAAVALLPLVLLAPPATDPSPAPVLALLSLGALSSGLAYVLYMHVIRLAGPTTAIGVMYVMPVVSTTLGVALLDESLPATMLTGMSLVLVGVAVSTRANAPVASTEGPA
jgi:drug/metabolite transporter (DMT)-like permease